MENTKFNRQQLYNLVWSEPLLRLSKIYCISDNGLRKMCKSMNIPLPPNGYWQKIRYGKRVTKVKLPIEHTGRVEVVLNPRNENCNDASIAITLQSTLSKEITSDKKSILEVPERLSSRPDLLITSTKKYREAIKKYDWSRGDNRPNRINVLSIDVSEESLPRAYRLMDTLIKLLRSRNHEVKVSHWNTVAVIEGEEIAFRLREKNKVSSEKTSYGSRIMEPTGNFVIAIGTYSWREKYINDGKQRLESKLAVILAKMEIEGKRQYDKRIESEKQHKIQEERDRIERELRERKVAELARFTNIYKEAIQLQHATMLRNYIAIIEKKRAGSDISEDWIRWAKDKIDWYDPTIIHEDLLLDDNCKAVAYKEFLSVGK